MSATETMPTTNDETALMGVGVHRLVREFLDVRLMDCMALMAEYPDNHFDLAIVDPPYGILNLDGQGSTMAVRKSPRQQGSGKLKNRLLNRSDVRWDKAPSAEYFAELRRVSRNQIVWGGNYFDLPPTRCVLCWDKEQPWENFSQWEMAWTSFDKPAAIFHRSNCGQEPGKIHPTQKPIRLYNWILSRFASPGQRILDTHMGSGSIAIACHYARLHLTASEIDEDYFKAACARIERETAQDSFDFSNKQITH
jgi:site-specific DNA-methyltransferase (adenine-specific)